MLTNAQKCRNEAYFDHIYTRLPCLLDYTVSTIVRNLNSSCRDSLAQIEEISSSIVWYKLLRVKVQKVHLSWREQNLVFPDPYLRNLNFICHCGMHIETLPFSKTDFQLAAEVAVTWQKRPPYLIWQYWLGVLGEFLSVTSLLMVESRNDRAENAWILGCIRRWAREVGGGRGRGYGWDFWRLLWKNCHKVSGKKQYFPIHVPRPIINEGFVCIWRRVKRLEKLL